MNNIGNRFCMVTVLDTLPININMCIGNGNNSMNHTHEPSLIGKNTIDNLQQ